MSSNGNLQFTGDSQAPGNECPLPSVVLDAAIQPFQGDLRTDAQPDCSVFSTGCGVFTSVAGTAPNRIFYIEWRTTYIDRPGTADFEVALYENNSSFYDVLYNCRYGQRGSKWGAGEQLRRPGYDLLVSGAYACERIESHLHLHRGDAYADSNTNLHTNPYCNTYPKAYSNTKTLTDAATSPDSVGVKVSDP